MSGVLDWFFGSSTVTQSYGQNGEPGVDIALAPHTVVKNVEAGVYDAALSTANEVVITDPAGRHLDYMHIDPAQLNPGQLIAAGAPVGTITQKDEPGGTFRGTTITKQYTSTGPHLEFGVYAPGQAVGTDYHPGIEPTGFLSQLANGGWSGSAGAPPAPSAGGLIPGTSGNPNAPVFGPGGTIDPTPWINGALDPAQQAAAGIVGPAFSQGERILLTGVFVIAALGVGLILVDKMSNGQLSDTAKSAAKTASEAAVAA